MLTDEGGGTAPVYGYGWGVVLWLAAILCGIAAIPALVLAIGSLVSAAEYLWSR